MSKIRKISWIIMAIASVIFVISLFNIPTQNIIGLVIGAGLGYTGFYLNKKY